MTNPRWKIPTPTVIDGASMRLAPLTLAHAAGLWAAAKEAPESFDFLRYGPFASIAELETCLHDLTTRAEQPFWAVVDASGLARGWASICDVSVWDGAFEIGSIWFSPALQGTRAAREAVFALMSLGMDDQRFERMVWRCLAQNGKSVQAALNFGFRPEGTWPNAAMIGDELHDVAWFSILRDEWPLCRAALVAWLADANFDAAGCQIRRLQDVRSGLGGASL